MGLEEVAFSLTDGPTIHTIISTPDSEHNEQPSLIFLHFWGGSNRTYHAVIDQLKSRYNIIAPSLRGWGNSSGLKYNDATTYSILNQSRDIASLIEILRVSKPSVVKNGVILLGHSMGGKIAQVLLAEPRIQNDIQGLILLAPAPSRSFRLDEDMRDQQIHAYESQESAKFVLENVLLSQSSSLTFDETEKITNDMVSGVKEAKEAWPAYSMAEDYENLVTSALSDFKRVRDKVFQILVIVGTDDLVEKPPNVKARVADLLEEAGAEVQWQQLEKVGHLSPLEAPEAVAKNIIKFVDRLSAAT